ncbi:MAG TPA: RodZ domain-containing protein [Burkholderiales bacterium]
MSDVQADSPTSAIQGPGNALAEAREVRGLSIDDVAMRLKFAPRQLEALEADRYDLLPGIAIVRGMVRSYARVLEIDATPLVAELEQRLQAGPRTVHPSDMHVPIREDRRDGRVLLVLSLIVLIAVAAFALEWYVRDRRAAQAAHVSPSAQGAAVMKQMDLAVKPMPVAQSVAPAPVAVEPSPVTEAPEPVIEAAPEIKEPVATASAAPSGEPASATVGKPLQMRFSGKVWVEVKDARGKVLVSRLADAGTLLALEGTPPLSVVLGNAAAVELSYGGERVDLAAHAPSGVARLTLE